MLIRGQGARVYRNLTRKTYSVQQRVFKAPSSSAWRVVGHQDSLYLTDVAFMVSQAGRLRVVNTGRKQVHAYVLGRYEGPAFIEPEWFSALPSIVRVHYNPFHNSTFVDEGGWPIYGGAACWLTPGGLYVAHPEYL